MDGKIMSTENTLAIVLMALISVSCFGASESKIEIFTEEKGNITQGDDIKQLKKLALSVGWDFSPNQITNAYLKDMNINRIRSINIDKFSGQFDKNGNYQIDERMTTRLDHNLKTCAEIGVIPHLVIGPSMPESLTR